jgi:hypothetical protein
MMMNLVSVMLSQYSYADSTVLEIAQKNRIYMLAAVAIIISKSAMPLQAERTL